MSPQWNHRKAHPPKHFAKPISDVGKPVRVMEHAVKTNVSEAPHAHPREEYIVSRYRVTMELVEVVTLLAVASRGDTSVVMQSGAQDRPCGTTRTEVPRT